MGRCLLSDTKIRKYCDQIMLGNAQELAAQFIGVSDRTVRGWLERGRRWQEAGRKPKRGTDLLCYMFTEEVRRAEAAFADRHIANISRVATDKTKPCWQASAWLLERRWPQHFGTKVEMRGKIEVITVAGEELTRPEADKFSKLLQPMMLILKEEITDAACLERIGKRIESVYGTG